MIEQTINTMIKAALSTMNTELDTIEIEVPNDKANGDYSTNVAMKLARVLRKAPLQIAKDIVAAFEPSDTFKKIEVAPPGFINFYVNKTLYHQVIHDINTKGSDYGNLDLGKGERFNIEYVSANPTGSLHIGHARGASHGDALSRVLKKAGYEVTREFYVNDGGNQIHNLTLSIDARYQQAFGRTVEMPADGYHGKEIIQLANQIKKEHGDRFLEEDGYDFFKKYGVEYLLDALRKDLSAFHVEFDVWFSEASLYKKNAVHETVNELTAKGYTYEKDGALWLKTTAFGDEKDRVIIKSDGTYTYVTPDIAYHRDKLSRGYTKLIDILGSDHHGYVPRLKAAIAMIGGVANLLEVDLMQMVKVIQDGEEVKMSKRSGKAITVADLIDEVGSDPIRYFFAMRSLNTQMELDLDLALKQTNENPVYYVQYAHARICSMLRQAEEQGFHLDLSIKEFNTLDNPKIDDILTTLVEYPKVIEEAASKRIPHRVTQYIHKLASALHSFYADEKVIQEDKQSTLERLALMHAVKVVLSDALNLVGVEAKERM